MSKYVLLVQSGKLKREAPVGEDPLVVGRGPEATLRLPDDYCSRVHGKFVMRDDELFIEDVGARNGIFVNGERLLLDARLDDGDEVRMGRTFITVRQSAAPSTPPVTSSDLNDTATRDLGPEGIQFVEPAAEIGFKLTKLVAVSGMGLLFEAEDVANKQAVAFKILRPDRATESNVARAVEEAKSLSRIRHKNIVSILSTGRLRNGESFLVMDFVDGLTATQLGKAGRLGIPEALRIAADTAGALEAVHQNGMVHRDVKPSNVMIEGKSERTVLIDFSLALTEGGGLAGAPAGTIIFCAPEQVMPQSPRDTMQPAVDIYGLGGTLYFMLTGFHPFKGSSAIEIHQKKIDDPIPKPSERNKFVHPSLDEIVEGCLQPKVENRLQNAEEVRRLLVPIQSLYPKSSGGKRDIRWAPTPTRRRSR
ncbi:MAG: FHA domain-containing serine/threonine-protein kinase [Planctomycetota bacterium]